MPKPAVSGVRLALAMVVLATVAGCAGLTSRGFGSSDDAYWFPLTVGLRLDPSVTEAALPYRDACQQSQTIPLGDRLAAAFRREVGMVFEHVQTDGGSLPNAPGQPTDGTVQIAMGFQETDLFIPRHEAGSYLVSVVLGATVTYVDQNGTVLFSKKLKTEVRGKVETTRDTCDARGLNVVAYDASTTLAQGIKKQLGASAKVRQAAAGQTGKGKGLSRTAKADAVDDLAPLDVPAQPLAATSTPRVQADGKAVLSFRVMLKDDNQDFVLDGGEKVTVVVEVQNAGPGRATGVKASLSGSPTLTGILPNPIPVGDLQPGETKRVESSGRMPAIQSLQQADLIISIDTAGPLEEKPRPKKFLAAMRPARSETVEILSVDVDQVPSAVRGYERRKAVGISIGIGSFRDPDVPGVKFAVHDAEVMAKYFRTVGGVSPKRIKLVTDGHVLKDDLAEIFEEWLPRQAEPGGVVFVFFAGRAVVDPLTGAVSLLPHEGRPATHQKAFSLRRLHTALARLPIEHAVLFLDVSLVTPSAPGSLDGKEPVWGMADLLDGKIVQMLAVSSKIQQTHQYDEGRHGLFTYHLLKGLGGEADKNHNGEVAVGELFEYARTRVASAAKSEYGNEQEPACVPALSPTSKAWSLPLARVK
ncbi:MAG TPA: caspase family protein [Nitrospiraceae bacterium]|nr:caspase family protein [Nitrospiraceae bacterium]